MPHVTTHYRIYLGAGHHRQPRNKATWVEPDKPGEADAQPGTAFTPYAPPTIGYTPQGGTEVTAGFVFWSVSDKTGGRTQQGLTLTETVGESDLTLVAWYYLPASGGGTGSGVLIDAYSVAASDFVDYDFVTVTSDPSLTSQANVAGVVPTAKAQKVQAFGSIPNGETFEHWIVSPGGSSAAGNVLTTPAGSGGLAFATYRHRELKYDVGRIPVLGGTILFGIAEGGGGVIVVGGKPIPIDPWGPLIGRLLNSVGIFTSARTLSKESTSRIREVTAGEITRISAELGELARKVSGGG